eukprot:383357-Rhodomonas_salina.4
MAVQTVLVLDLCGVGLVLPQGVQICSPGAPPLGPGPPGPAPSVGLLQQQMHGMCPCFQSHGDCSFSWQEVCLEGRRDRARGRGDAQIRPGARLTPQRSLRHSPVTERR